MGSQKIWMKSRDMKFERTDGASGVWAIRHKTGHYLWMESAKTGAWLGVACFRSCSEARKYLQKWCCIELYEIVRLKTPLIQAELPDRFNKLIWIAVWCRRRPRFYKIRLK